MKYAAALAFGCLMATSGQAEEIGITLSRPQGRLSCESPGRAELTGSVMHADAKSFTLDLCLPTQECSVPIPAEISVDAPGFSGFFGYLRPGAFIHVSVGIDKQGGVCARQITVASLASWTGARTPSGRGDALYFAAGDNASAIPARPCTAGDGTLSITAEKTRLTVREPAPRIPGGFSARLLRTGPCDSLRGWSYWIAAPVPR